MSLGNVHYIRNFFIRYDKGVGVLAYSNDTGLLYAYSFKGLEEEEKKDAAKGKNLENIVDKITKNIGNNRSRLLPMETDWPGPEQEKLSNPITINWLITKECTHHCSYCYATDVMNNENLIEENNLRHVSERILSYKPLNVVISGGEPLLHANLEDVIECLSGKTGIIIDTNGICYERLKELLPTIIKNKIVIRISIDDLRVENEYKIRSPKSKNISKTDNLFYPIKSLTMLMDNNVKTIVQTVLTQRNANDLYCMGDKLYVLGVRAWRIFEMQITPHNKINIELNKLNVRNRVKNKKESRQKTIHIIGQLRKAQRSRWMDLNLIVTEKTSEPNNVFLVLPDGRIYTEGKHETGKIHLNEKNPLSDLSSGAHFTRYID